MSIIKNLKVNLGDFLLDVPVMEWPDEGITALWGPSGSGKTTLLRCLMGFVKVPEMTWNFKGQEMNQLSVRERRLGVVFQTQELFPHMTAQENILFAAKARKLASVEAVKKLNEYAQILEMESYLRTKGAHLSGGESQRVALARAIIGGPRMLLLDEPFSSLDQGLRQKARELVKVVLTKEKIPALLVTHDKEDVKALASHVIHMEKGRIGQHGRD